MPAPFFVTTIVLRSEYGPIPAEVEATVDVALAEAWRQGYRPITATAVTPGPYKPIERAAPRGRGR